MVVYNNINRGVAAAVDAHIRIPDLDHCYERHWKKPSEVIGEWWEWNIILHQNNRGYQLWQNWKTFIFYWCLCVCVCDRVPFFLAGPRAFKFGTYDPWDIISNYFFYFFKILKIDPSRSIFDLFFTYFLKSGAIFFWLVQILSFFGFWTSWEVVRASFLNFSKICIFASVTDPRRFSFFKNRRKLTFFSQFCTKCCAIFFWLALGPRYFRRVHPMVS